ncbi:fungal transcriptional regulatory protein [Scheffersomyces amazonensis]|uniref:fungal transcriptional regulatory protein n=1 Tax=Scheffersomyces amazonensis TaxID=1078765 RepID=UPI00315DA904
MTSNIDQKIVKKRKRPSLVCENCKKKKIRCDKGQPCNQCVKSNSIHTCRYDTEGIMINNAGHKSSSLPYISSAKNPIPLFSKFSGNESSTTKKSTADTGHLNALADAAHHAVTLDSLYDSASSSSANLLRQKANKDSISVSMSELNTLKERLHQIESLLGKDTSSAQSTSPDTISLPIPSQQNLSNPAPASASASVSVSVSPPAIIQPAQPQSTPVPQLNPYISQYSNQPPPPPSYRSNPIHLPPLQFKNYSQSPLPSTNTPSQIVNNPDNDTRTKLSSNSSSSTKSSPFAESLKTSAVSPASALSEKLVKATDSSSLLGIHPYANETERINLFEDYTSIHIKEPSRRINFGPFAWSSIMKKDMGLRILWDYVSLKDDERTMAATVFSQAKHEVTAENLSVFTGNDSGESESNFRKRALETDGYTDALPYNAILKARVDKNIQRSKLNENTLPLGLTFYDGKIDRELQLIEKIRIILPSKKIIWMLVHRYFSWLYAFMPFMDEECFMTNIIKIIGPESDEEIRVEKLEIERRLDLAYIGLLLVILRLSYLSLFCNDAAKNEYNLNNNDPSPKAQEVKYLLSNPININTIDVAELCLDQFQLLRKTAFPVFQLAFYLRLYHLYAPEDGDGADGGDSQVLIAVLVQMAYSLGLNRDPDNFPDVLNNKRENQVGRKMWNFLVLADLHQAYSFGNPSNIDDNSYDTKVPVYEPGTENISDILLDKFVTESYFECSTMSVVLRKILKLVLNVKDGANMAELCKLLDEFELLIDRQHGTLEDCLKPLDKEGPCFIFTRNFRTKFYLSLKSFCISVYYHLYLYYERKNVELSYFYLKKILLICCTDIMPHYFTLLSNTEIICDMIINPTLEQIIHKSNQNNLALIVRVNFIIYHLKKQPEHMAKMSYDTKYSIYYRDLCRFSSCLTRAAEVSIAAISKISNRYYYAWRVTKGHTFLLKTITSMQFYDDNYSKAGNLCIPLFTLEQMDEMIDICERMLHKVGKFKESMFCVDATFKPSPNETSSIKAESPNSNSTIHSNSISTNSSEPNTVGSSKEKDKEQVDQNFTLENIDNAEIDKLWFQMLALKYDSNKNYDENTIFQSQEARRQSHAFPGLLPASPNAAAYTNGLSNGNNPQNAASPANKVRSSISHVNSPFGAEFPIYGPGLDRLGFNAEQANQFDIFSELPFERVFSKPE